MKLNRTFACVMSGAALVAAVISAPAMAVEDQPSGSVTVPLGSTGGCSKSITVYWNSASTPPVGTYGNVTC